MPELNEPKICRNCKWHFASLGSDLCSLDLCSHPKTTKVNLVTGDKGYPFCEILREDRWPEMQGPNYCGSEGKNYEPKNSG